MADSTGPILMVAAMREELAPTLRRIGAHVRNRRVHAIVTGLGGDRAETAIAKAFDSVRPSQVLHIGVAGALKPGLTGVLRIGRVMDEHRNAIPLATRDANATLLTVDRPALTPEAKTALFDQYRADAVDMETFRVARLARDTGVPLTALRAISDAANEAILPEALEWVDAELGVASPLAAMRHLAVHPWDLPAVMRMGRQMRRATRALADVVAKELDHLTPLD